LEKSHIFKKYPNCGHIWHDRESFLADPEVQLNGYQANFENLKLGLLLFDHQKCRATMAINASDFRDLFDGPVFEKRKTNTDEYPGYCLRPKELARCPVECECA